MAITLTDTLSLVTKGYKTSDIKDLKKVVDENPDDEKTIIDLAKKLSPEDLKATIDIFKKSEENDPEENDPEENDPEENDPEDKTDYKKLYEKEKELRTKIQKDNQNKDISGKEGKKTDEEIALEFATSILNG